MGQKWGTTNVVDQNDLDISNNPCNINLQIQIRL